MHSFPDLSLVAWTYTGIAPEPDDESEDDDENGREDDNTAVVEPVMPVTPYGQRTEAPAAGVLV